MCFCAIFSGKTKAAVTLNLMHPLRVAVQKVFQCFMQWTKQCHRNSCWLFGRAEAIPAPNLLLSFNSVEGGEAKLLFLEGARAILRASIDFSMVWSPLGAALGTWKHDSTKNGAEPAASQALKWEPKPTFHLICIGLACKLLCSTRLSAHRFTLLDDNVH